MTPPNSLPSLPWKYNTETIEVWGGDKQASYLQDSNGNPFLNVVKPDLAAFIVNAADAYALLNEYIALCNRVSCSENMVKLQIKAENTLKQAGYTKPDKNLIRFRLDGHWEGQGYIRKKYDNVYDVELTSDCKEYTKGMFILVDKNEIVE